MMAPDALAAQRGFRLEDRTELFGTLVMPDPAIRFQHTPKRAGALPKTFGSDRVAVLSRIVPATEST
jgi:hypothetical protein